MSDPPESDPRNAARVRAELARLRDAYGDAPLEEERVENDPGRFARGIEMIEDGWLGDAAALVRDDRDRALLIRHPGAPDEWTLPGGGHDPARDDGLDDTARRELREETGVVGDLREALWFRRKEFVHATDPDRRGRMLTAVFAARHVEGSPDATGDEEILEARWFSDRPDELADWLGDVLERTAVW